VHDGGSIDALASSCQIIDSAPSPRFGRPKGDQNRVRQKINFARLFKLMGVFSPVVQNISLYENQKLCISWPILLPPEGRIAIVTDVGCGMRWTQLRD
jgi:hypothetical protein